MTSRLLALVVSALVVVTMGTTVADATGALPPISQCYTAAVNGGPDVTLCKP